MALTSWSSVEWKNWKVQTLLNLPPHKGKKILEQNCDKNRYPSVQTKPIFDYLVIRIDASRQAASRQWPFRKDLTVAVLECDILVKTPRWRGEAVQCVPWMCQTLMCRLTLISFTSRHYLTYENSLMNPQKLLSRHCTPTHRSCAVYTSTAAGQLVSKIRIRSIISGIYLYSTILISGYCITFWKIDIESVIVRRNKIASFLYRYLWIFSASF